MVGQPDGLLKARTPAVAAMLVDLGGPVKRRKRAAPMNSLIAILSRRWTPDPLIPPPAVAYQNGEGGEAFEPGGFAAVSAAPLMTGRTPGA